MFELLFIIAIVVHFILLTALVREIRQIRADLAERIGSIAEASWRIRDELTAMNRRAEGKG